MARGQSVAQAEEAFDLAERHPEADRARQFDNVVVLLANSIMLNVDKGSPIGLAFNRQALGALAKAAAQAHGLDAERLRSAVADLTSRLAQAEAVLGRVGLPGEASEQTETPWGA